MLTLRFTKILGFLSLIVTLLNMKMYSCTLSWGSGLLITTQFFKIFTILEQLINDLHLHAKPIPFVPILGKNNNLLLLEGFIKKNVFSKAEMFTN